MSERRRAAFLLRLEIRSMHNRLEVILDEQTTEAQREEIARAIQLLWNVEAVHVPDVEDDSYAGRRLLENIRTAFGTTWGRHIPEQIEPGVWVRNFSAGFHQLVLLVREETGLSYKHISRRLGLDNIQSLKTKPTSVTMDTLTELCKAAKYTDTQALGIIWTWMHAVYGQGIHGPVFRALMSYAERHMDTTELLKFCRMVGNYHQTKKRKK